MTSPDDAARLFVLTQCGEVVSAVDRCADAVADTWDEEAVDEGAAVVEPLRACLREAGVLEALPGVLVGAVEATGRTLRATPVAAPPYVVVTSRGPVCRATLADGRLVLRFRAFTVSAENQYVRGASGDELVDVEFVG